MNYRETLEYLYSRLPVFTRIGVAAYKANLDNIEALCKALGQPEKAFKSIHIAGTNGKGSASHFLASVFQQSGYKTGLFTSPHLKDFRERIKVNGRQISRRDVIRFTRENLSLYEQLQPSFFEMTVALAFDHFRNQKVDIAIIETGLGGRLDSTNVIVPECSLITNISFDHMDLLGNTLEKIAGEKAGIIKKGIPVVISEKQEQTAEVFQEKAKLEKSTLLFAEDLVEWKEEETQKTPAINVNLRNTSPFMRAGASVKMPGETPVMLKIQSPLGGLYQYKNLKGVLVTLELLKTKGWKLPAAATEKGIRNVIKNTGLRGRWEFIGRRPDIVCDTGHNEAGVREVLQQAAQSAHTHLHVVWGVTGDKDVGKILSLLPDTATYYFCNANIPRAMDARLLQAKGLILGLKGKSYKSTKQALAAAKRKAKKTDLILVGGSTFVVAEVI